MIHNKYGSTDDLQAVLTVTGAASTDTVKAYSSVLGKRVTGVWDSAAGAHILTLSAGGAWEVSCSNEYLTTPKTVSIGAPGPYALAFKTAYAKIGAKYTFTALTYWICPQTGLYTIEVHGGGGGGGGGSASSAAIIMKPGGSGGGSGAVGTGILLKKGTVYNISVGKGGAGGSEVGANGSAGGTSKIVTSITFSISETLVSVGGGGGGTGGSGGAGGSVGSVTGSGFTNVASGSYGGGTYGSSYGAGGDGGGKNEGGGAGKDGGVFIELTAYV